MPDTADLEKQFNDLVAFVGTRWHSELGRIDAMQFQRFATATGDQDPLVWSIEAAQAAGLPSRQAPPLYLTAVMAWGAGPPTAELRADGVARTMLDDLPLAGLRLMGGGQNLEFLAPVTDGLMVSCDIELLDVQQKQGRSGSLILLDLLTVYRDAEGTELVRCGERIIAR
jgi:acyl dehydratase